MSDQTPIQWTDATWNPVRGCTKISPGCANCYAETFAERWRGIPGHPYEQGFDLRLAPNKLTEPLRWKKPRRIFVNSMSDLFHEVVPVDYIDQVFAVMALAPQHTFQVLTKRAELMRYYLSAPLTRERVDLAMDQPSWLPANSQTYPRRSETWPLPNVWLGVSVENEHFMHERVPLLKQTPAAVRFISCEPLLEPLVGLGDWLYQGADNRPFWTAHCPVNERGYAQIPGIDWVILGGESGHGARPFHVSWARSIVEQCRDAGVACFVKQLGSRCIDAAHDHRDWPAGTRAHAGATMNEPRWIQLTKKGGVPSEWPTELQVRQFPGA